MNVVGKEDKVPVFAFIERSGRRLIASADDTTEETVIALAEPRIEPEAQPTRTTSPPTRFLIPCTGTKPSIDRGICPWRGSYKQNTCEGEFSIFRPFMAVHRGVAKYNMPLYASLYQLHRELRQMEAIQALEQAIKATLFALFLKRLVKALTLRYQQDSYLRA
jgi:hypothetical protein